MSGIPYSDATDNRLSKVTKAQSITIEELSDQIGETSYDLHNNLYIEDTLTKKIEYTDLWTSISTLEKATVFEQVEDSTGNTVSVPSTYFPIGTTKLGFPTGFILYPTTVNINNLTYILTNKSIEDLVGATPTGTRLLENKTDVRGRRFQNALNYYADKDNTGFTYAKLYQLDRSFVGSSSSIAAELLAMDPIATVVNRAAQLALTPDLADALLKLDQALTLAGYEFLIFKQAGDDGSKKIFDTPGLRIGGGTLVDTIKTTCAEILAAPIKNAPITCQALLDSASCAVITGDEPATGYDTLPPSGRKIHDYIESLKYRPARMTNVSSGSTNANVPSPGVIFSFWKSGTSGSEPSFGLYPFNGSAEGYAVDNGPLVAGTTKTNSFKTLVAGYYRFTNVMFFFNDAVDRTAIISQFAKSPNGSNHTVDSSFIDFGCRGASSYIREDGGHHNASNTISEIVHCNVGDHIGVRLKEEAATGTVTTPTGFSNFMAELLHPGSA